MGRKWKDLTDAEKDWAVEQRLIGMIYDEIFGKLGVTEGHVTAARKLRARVSEHKGSVGKDEEAEALSDLEKDVLVKLRASPCKLEELSNILDRGQDTIRDCIEELKQKGFAIYEAAERVSVPATPPIVTREVPPLWDKSARRIKWASGSDLHYGSKYVQKTAIKHFVKRAYEGFGIKHILWSGDIVAGQHMYRGQEYDLYAHGVDEQVDDVANSLPMYDGLTHYVMGGNHDASFFRKSGVDILIKLASIRKDIIHCGWASVDVPLTENVYVKMWHPRGSPAYAVSYRGQKYAEQIAFDELLKLVFRDGDLQSAVRMLQVGHFHVVGGPFTQGPIEVFNAGGFEGQNSYLKELGRIPTVGGYIFEAEITEDGVMRELVTRRYLAGAIEDDWRPGPNEKKVDEVKIVPLFKLVE